MQLALTADWLVPLGAGVVVLAALLLLVLVLRQGRRQARERAAESSPTPARPAQPERRDRPEWRDAAAERTDPVAATPSPPAPTSSFAAVPAHWSSGMRSLTPEPVEPSGAAKDQPADQTPMAPAPDGPPTGPVPVAPWTRAGATVEPRPDDPPDHPAPSRDQSGSSRTVAAAVAQAFAVRAAADRAGGPPPAPHDPSRSDAQKPPEPPRDEPPARPNDVKDRLLAVLLNDPQVAVDATIQLDACRAQLDRLSTAVRHERQVLREVLNRLADSGLRTDQLARLAGMPVEELQALMAPASR